MPETGVKIEAVTAAIETLAPLRWAQAWDNVGLLIGNPNAQVRRILLTIDTTRAVVAEAKRVKADLILSYHPVMFKGVKRITAAGPAAHLYDLIRFGIGLYSFHTAMDVAPGGVNDALAQAVGMTQARPLGDFVEEPGGPSYKIVTFVPQDSLDKVADALYASGAGSIGHYSHCGFQTEGTGTFLPLAGAHPTVGQRGRRETVAEIKLETVVTAAAVGGAIAALHRAHPYDTPAFDVFRHYDLENRLGLGRIGPLAHPAKLQEVLARLKKATGARTAGIVGKHNRQLKTAAVCAGSCGDLLSEVVTQGADLYVTGELTHHRALEAQEAGLTCICLSHTVSERFALKHIARQLKSLLPGITLRQSRKDADPLEWSPL